MSEAPQARRLRTPALHMARRHQGFQPIGSVQAAYCRLGPESAPRRMLRVETVAGRGIVGDLHACPHSPRQLLIADDAAYAHFGLPESTLRENVRIDFSTSELRSGDALRLGTDVVLWLTFHCEPCHLIDRHHVGTAKAIGKHRGMLARVLRGGSFGVGDEVSLSRAVLPNMSDEWQARVLEVARAVPAGHHISYRRLAEMAGVAVGYCRAFPKVLSRLPSDVSSRIVSSRCDAKLGPQWDGDDMFNAEAHLGWQERGCVEHATPGQPEVLRADGRKVKL